MKFNTDDFKGCHWQFESSGAPYAGDRPPAADTFPVPDVVLHDLEVNAAGQYRFAGGTEGRVEPVTWNVPQGHVLDPFLPGYTVRPFKRLYRGRRYIGELVGGKKMGKMERDFR